MSNILNCALNGFNRYTSNDDTSYKEAMDIDGLSLVWIYSENSSAFYSYTCIKLKLLILKGKLQSEFQALNLILSMDQ